jgi:regulator of cell morphogenesis and NO signaling
MPINSATTVRQLAIEIPGATRVFEKLKIDYCCGGNKPLAEACANAGLDLGEVEQQLALSETARVPETTDFNEMRLLALIEHIVNKHHVFTKGEMLRLEALTTKVESVHGENHPELRQVSILFKTLCNDLSPHMFKEEQVLFPYIVELERASTEKRTAPFAPFGTVNNPVRMMMREHDAAGEILRELRKVTSDYAVPTDVCISYKTLYESLEAFEKDLHQHIHLENNILFPGAIALENIQAR